MTASTPDTPQSADHSPLAESSSKLYADPHAETIKDRIGDLKIVVPDTEPAAINILAIKSDERKLLLEGPNTSIIADGNVIIRKAVPVRALKASCTKVRDLFQIKPRATQFRVYGRVNSKSIEKLLDTFTTESLVEAKVIKLSSPTTSFVEGVLTYQACLALGIVYHHTRPLLNSLCAQITTRILTIEEMSTVVNRCPPQDPLFRHLANSLCHRRFKKQILDIPAFEHWLSKKPTLQKAMMEIDQAHKKRRTAIIERKCSWRPDAVVAKQGHDNKEEGKE
ncbi:hypothetical protein NX059_007014 [Plenodomus lindquistii]|nr:hypothetical protein NX059_007014 [Plenodomus lindquistii]